MMPLTRAGRAEIILSRGVISDRFQGEVPMRIFSRICFLAALVISLIAPRLHALTVIPPTFEELVSKAEIVVDGEVAAVRTELSSYQGRPLVYTFVTIRVLDALKGAPGANIEMRMLGGTVGDVTLHVSGVPKFQPGERNLFFIEGNGVNFCPLVAVPHGFYPIKERASDGATVVTRSNGEPLADVAEVGEDLQAHARAHGGTRDAAGAMTLSDFKSRIRAEVAHAREQ
jgi:hypothetical protein